MKNLLTAVVLLLPISSRLACAAAAPVASPAATQDQIDAFVEKYAPIIRQARSDAALARNQEAITELAAFDITTSKLRGTVANPPPAAELKTMAARIDLITSILPRHAAAGPVVADSQAERAASDAKTAAAAAKTPEMADFLTTNIPVLNDINENLGKVRVPADVQAELRQFNSKVFNFQHGAQPAPGELKTMGARIALLDRAYGAKGLEQLFTSAKTECTYALTDATRNKIVPPAPFIQGCVDAVKQAGNTSPIAGLKADYLAKVKVLTVAPAAAKTACAAAMKSAANKFLAADSFVDDCVEKVEAAPSTDMKAVVTKAQLAYFAAAKKAQEEALRMPGAKKP